MQRRPPVRADEVSRALGIDSVLALPFDRRGAALIAGPAATDRWLRRSPLMRSVGALNDMISRPVPVGL